MCIRDSFVIGGILGHWLKTQKLNRKPYGIVDHFMVETIKMKKEMAEAGFENVITLPNFKDIPATLPQKRNHKGPVRFVFLSRIIPEKDVYKRQTIHGEVQYPGIYKYADNETLEDFVLQAGGLKETASTVRVDVARRVNNPKALTTDSIIAVSYTHLLRPTTARPTAWPSTPTSWPSRRDTSPVSPRRWWASRPNKSSTTT